MRVKSLFMKEISLSSKKGFGHILIAFDILFIFLLWRFTYHIRLAYFDSFLRFYSLPQIFDRPLLFLPVVIILSLILNYSQHFYRLYHISPSILFLKSIRTAFYLGLLLLAFSAVFRELFIGRSVLLLYPVLYGTYLFCSRYLIRLIRIYLIDKGWFSRNVLIIGMDELALQTRDILKDIKDIKYNIIGFLSDSQESPGVDQQSSHPVLGHIAQLSKIVKKHDIDEVIFATEKLNNEELVSIISKYEHLPIHFKIVSNLFKVITEQVKLGDIAEFPLVEINNQHPSLGYCVSKRIMDLIITIPLFVLTLPLGLIIVIAIKLDSPGPVVFKHERIGKNGKPFLLYKFRSMLVSSNPYETAPSTDKDDRITRTGKILRKTSLDELPQLLNILKGDMSLVGPRPEMPFIVDGYKKWQKKRLEVKPGLTGLWQIAGRKHMPLNMNLEYDFYYIKHRSLLFDLFLLLKTIPAVLFGKGAY